MGGGGGEAEIIYIISGGGEGPFLVRYEKCVCVYVGGGGMQSASSPIQKVGAFGTANTLSL